MSVRIARAVLLAVLFGLCSGAATADRILLAPSAELLPPQGFKTELVFNPSHLDSSVGWLQVSTVQGIELEGERLGLPSGSNARYVLNLEYPLLPDLGAMPSVAVGIRDLFGTGVDHKALFAAATKSVPLSDRQLKFARSLELSIGVGTGRLDGPFIGGEALLASGIGLYAEVYRKRPDFGVSVPLGKRFQARAYSLDGTPYLGVEYSLVH
ncbi:MAG TPA: YjbH domain-containing protein [Chthonomonadales bacterium]|nr:YjbH domain-containing protein [Chthonomonadales bacterium]